MPADARLGSLVSEAAILLDKVACSHCPSAPKAVGIVQIDISSFDAIYRVRRR